MLNVFFSLLAACPKQKTLHMQSCVIILRIQPLNNSMQSQEHKKLSETELQFPRRLKPDLKVADNEFRGATTGSH